MTYRARGAGGRIDEVPIAFTDRVRGTSKMSGRIVAEAMTLVTLWGLRDRVFRRRQRHR
jgi:dolichol-phosphate mannosyltransferase